MLLGVGNRSAGDHKGGVGPVEALTQPPQPPQNKGCVAAKHSPATPHSLANYTLAFDMLLLCAGSIPLGNLLVSSCTMA